MNNESGSTGDGERKAGGGHLRGFLASSLNLLGPLGGVLSASLLDYWTTERLKHLETTIAALEERLESFPRARVEGVLRTKEFLHLLTTVMEKAQKEHRETKRRHYGVMLANMAAEPKFEYDLFDHFVSLLGELGDLHIALLLDLNKRGVQKREDTGWASFDHLVAIGRRVTPPQAQEVVNSALQKLAAYGIVKTSGPDTLAVNINPVGLWYHSSYSITPTGDRFLGFLREV